MDATRVLVTYASPAGSTEDIARRVANRITSDLHVHDLDSPQVVCRPVRPDLDPGEFDALVVGSAVHNMAWLPVATSFLARATRADLPVWTFSVGGVEPRGPLTRAVVGLERRRVEQGFPAGFTPRDHQVFGGVVVMKGVPLWGRLFWRLMGGRPGDHRNWPTIEAWATGIATELAIELTAVPPEGRRRRP